MLKHVMEPLHERQIEALRKASNISTFYLFLEMNDFAINLATKSGRKDEMEKLARDSAARRENNSDAFPKIIRFGVMGWVPKN